MGSERVKKKLLPRAVPHVAKCNEGHSETYAAKASPRQ